MPIHNADIELDEGEEGDAFIPNGNSISQSKKHSSNTLIRWLIIPIRVFFKTLSTIKLVIFLLATFFVLLGLSRYWNNRRPFVSVVIPAESLALSKELAKNLSGTLVPEFVLTYAPLVFLDKGDNYFPSDLAAHVANTYPTVNFSHVNGAPENLTLSNLDVLNKLGGEEVYLTSTSPLMDMPAWMKGTKPNPKTLRTEGAVSCVVIIVTKAEGVVDVFYMYFYSFNDGPSALGHKAGNHLGDWEHNAIRFVDGVPMAIWYSQHDYGQAISYSAAQKIGKRPVSFSARGSHANYLTGDDYDLAGPDNKIPSHIIYDHCSQGPLWDPTLSAYYYSWAKLASSSASSSPSAFLFTPANNSRSIVPTGYLNFEGKWGDKQYADDATGQEEFQGYRKWTGGPQGPIFKYLDRPTICLPKGYSRECLVETKLP